MKILFIINKFGGGGRERRLIQLIRGLDSVRGFELHATIFCDKIEYPDVECTSLKIHRLNFTGRRDQIIKYKSIVDSVRPDIIHNWIETPTECLILPILSKMYKCKYIAGFVADGNRIKSFIQRMSVKYTFVMADAVISNSKAGLVAKDAPIGKSYVIYNGFDNSRLSKVDRNIKRRLLEIQPDVLVSMAARIDDAKDWNMYVRLAELSAEHKKNVQFLAIGNGEKLEYYQEFIEKKGLTNIRFIGRRTDVEEIIDASDICILFTNNAEHAEGVSNFIMESMASGKPVIATDGGGTPEIIDNGVDGYIIAPGDINKAYFYLNYLIENCDVYKKISICARKKIDTKFMLSQMTDSYINLYNKIMSR